MNIVATIKTLSHKPLLQETLDKIDFSAFDINSIPPYCTIVDGEYLYALSKWVSPKRTRSYPFERVYNTLSSAKKITVIPIVKDEGCKGDRDFIQWDTISLMSLLDVYVILAYYSDADASPKAGKVTNQQYDNAFVKAKIQEIERFHLSALHWNLAQLESSSPLPLVRKVKTAYSQIEAKTSVRLHDLKGLDKFQENIQKDVTVFKKFSRTKASQAQQREIATIQPKERLTTATKAKITITNYLGGQYFFTVDEVEVDKALKNISLIECKHSSKAKLPSKSDIKDGLLKMALYSNLDEVHIDGIKTNHQAILLLSSSSIKGVIVSKDNDAAIETFINDNGFSKTQKSYIKSLMREARENNFAVKIMYSK